jgi:hypothetical protein
MEITKSKKEVRLWVRGEGLYKRRQYEIAKIVKFKKGGEL